MKLWVLRHGEAEPHARSDAERNLTEHGRQEALRSAAHLIGQPLSAIIASPYARAQQTAKLVREALGFEAEIRTVSWLTPDNNPLSVVAQLDSADNVLLVSHQPLVGNLIGFLQHGHLRNPQPMHTAGLAELEGDWPLAGLMTLNSIKNP
ncbi:phosphohistidine phosphatase, SixA [Pseudomonas chlororaphis]|uniref:phosphohistidine phosphatase SixA n=1 Tax=Pseudomonas chlororaphis TaxID=587753 RepID=UPI00087C0545|nr:phosphohistidine phosphatase SixA [Pseudomonas chlororaphis]AZD47183.1 Phosphohistidine phosphatase SixA [Pseudomonas chlororaphis subsp. aurantiaca]AZD65653.1 Phosphohistidine phosphatase SixA [Pseudomonas chlororaphis subsp. aurantiaca]AZD72128.1 Phosphohistidine phosphatase SixA [Pseudomonas chlororaphis subsp. aurantiaca]NNB45017.1 phosphohistidine phosphatase SixA [Pseudomonas chlororaphis]QIT21777.1 phosphohistidine phosphatase SixA [Pseudomonas chlororaphis subsp. aurantiaca]